MVSGIGGITAKVIEFAMDGLSLRHNAIASNIANSNTEGYRPIQVDFESKITELLASQNAMSPSSFDLSRFEPQVSFGTPLGQASNGMAFEMNTAMLNQNVVQYQALVQGLDAYMANVAEAIKEGKR